MELADYLNSRFHGNNRGEADIGVERISMIFALNVKKSLV